MTGLSREDIIAKASELGFEDVGFTTADPFDTHLGFLKDRQDEYGWAEAAGLKLLDGTDPKTVMPGAQTIIVLMKTYFRKRFPRHMEGHFGRCYLDDDRCQKVCNSKPGGNTPQKARRVNTVESMSWLTMVEALLRSQIRLVALQEQTGSPGISIWF